MECNQQQTQVATTKTLYENFFEEKCESDLVIPDYFPAAEKIIQCSATPVITSKNIDDDRLNIEGTCRFCIIYMGEEDGEIRSLSETVNFSESFLLKDAGNQPWCQAVARLSGTSCRLLNPRKISAKTTVSIAIKVKDQCWTPTIETIDCNEAEALFASQNVYTVSEHFADTVRIQGEIEVHTNIQDVLKAEGSVCIKDVKLMPGKAIVKGVADLFLLFTPEDRPNCVESTSTAIPFSQVIDLKDQDDHKQIEAYGRIVNIRSDVEVDDAGKNRIIAVSVTVMSEGEVFENREQQLLQEIYSNSYPLEYNQTQVTIEEIVEQGSVTENVIHRIPWEETNVQIIQGVGAPLIQKVVGQEKFLLMEGILDVSLFIKEGEQYRSIDKSFPFTVKKAMAELSGQMRCEVRPCVLKMECDYNDESIEIKTEILCNLTVFSKKTVDMIAQVSVDVDHPIVQSHSLPLIVYFAEKGERIWDIARKYATSVSKIKQINELEQDTLRERKLLLISR